MSAGVKANDYKHHNADAFYIIYAAKRTLQYFFFLPCVLIFLNLEAMKGKSFANWWIVCTL